MESGGTVRRAYVILCAVFCFAALFILSVPPASASVDATVFSNSTGFKEYSFSDLLAAWGSALIDPEMYTAWMHIDGFSSFLMNETFLSAFSSNTYGSLNRDTILGTIPNIFFVVCIFVVILSIAITVIELRKLEESKRVIRK